MVWFDTLYLYQQRKINTMKIFYVNNEGQEITIDTDKTNVFVLCDECEGNGEVEQLSCSKPSSVCCGGCTEFVVCDECEGSEMTNINDLI